MKCERCGQCCGMVPMTLNMFNRFKDKAVREFKLRPFDANFVVPVTDDNNCVFLSEENLCLIYNNRPMVCRQYGNIKALPCCNLHPERANQEFEKVVVSINNKMLEEVKKL